MSGRRLLGPLTGRGALLLAGALALWVGAWVIGSILGRLAGPGRRSC